MVRICLWLVSIGASFYAGIWYCGWNVINVPDSHIVKIITFIKTVQKISGVL